MRVQIILQVSNFHQIIASNKHVRETGADCHSGRRFAVFRFYAHEAPAIGVTVRDEGPRHEYAQWPVGGGADQ